MLLSLITAPLSWIYGLVIAIRNKLFEGGILRSEEFGIPIICVGNLTVGGTGKTPFTEFLIECLKDKYNIGVVSRGYKRRTKGYVRATEDSRHQQIGDEPKQIKIKFPNVEVAVCEKRVEGIRRLREECPHINLIILDDAFQHRYVEPWLSIILMDYNRPIYKDHLLPWGRLRDSISELPRAGMVVVTKCPEDIKPVDIRAVAHRLRLFPYQSLFFSQLQYAPLEPLFKDVAVETPRRGGPIIAMSGIANPEPLNNYLSQNYNVMETLIFPDHYTYRVSDMRRLCEKLEQMPEQTVIVITQKDAAKLQNRSKIPEIIQQRLFVLPIKISLLGEGNEVGNFLKKLEPYVIKNQKYSELHP